jgi:Flp pilus assembly protein TadG
MNMRRWNQTAGVRSAGKQAGNRTRDQQGQAAVEFALVLPFVLTVLVASAVYGLAFNQSSQLTYATNSAAQLLSISRGQTTDPCQTTSQAVYSAAPYLNPSQLYFTIVLGGHSVTSNAAQPSCSSGAQYMVQAQSAQVTVSYPCNLKILGFNPVPNCMLSAQTTALIQ